MTQLYCSTIHPICKYCVNYQPYGAILEPTGVCDGNLDLLLVITSSHREDAYTRRNTIRRTWGKLDNPIYKINRLFVLGRFFMLNPIYLSDKGRARRNYPFPGNYVVFL